MKPFQNERVRGPRMPSHAHTCMSMIWCNTVVTQFFKILQERQKTDFFKN